MPLVKYFNNRTGRYFLTSGSTTVIYWTARKEPIVEVLPKHFPWHKLEKLDPTENDIQLFNELVVKDLLG